MGGTSIEDRATRRADGLSNCALPVYSVPMTSNRTRLIVLLLAIVAAAALRLVPHPPNFTPIGAMALFSGAYVGRRALAFAAPLAALALSDIILGFYPGMIYQYVGTAIAVTIGLAALSLSRGPLRVGLSALASALLFFALSNFGVWLGSGMYPRSVAGLAEGYAAAVPFFQNSLAGDLFYTVLLFGGFAAAERLVPTLREATPQPS